MRILAIRGENLASLGQPFVIDFEAEPLAGTGLFAITGETGSGKSTILDALCLALYGRYPRFAETQQDTSPDPGGKVKILDGSTILRRGAGKGYAEVDFIGQDNLRYRARWGARRARNKADGAIQSAVRSLHSFSGEIITSVATSKTEVQDAITLRTGLTFDQFRRTVLLAQGDFDSFLLAPERERGELLEKITGTEIYGRISIRVAEGTRMLRLEAEALELQLVSLGLLSSEDREALAQTIHVLQQTVATKTNEGQAIQSRIHHVDNLTRARASLDAAEENLRTARVTSGDAGEERARLAELRAVEPLRSLRNRLAAALGQQAPAKQRAATAQGTLLQAQTAARTTKETLDSSRSAHNSTEAIFKDFGPVWDEAARLDSEFSTAHTETENSRSDAQVARGAVNTMDAELEAIKELIQHTNSALETVTAELAERSHQFTLADRLADVEALVLRHTDLAKEATAAISRESVANETTTGLEASTSALEVQIDEDNSELERLATLVLALQSEAEALDESALQADEAALTELHRRARDSQQLAEKYSLATSRRDSGHASNMQASDAVANAIARFAASTAEGVEQRNRRTEVHRHAELAEESIHQRNAHLRSLLVEGENCPICGATEHPYAAAGAIDALTLLAKDLGRQRAAIDGAIAASNNDTQQAATDRATAEGRAEAALLQESQASRELEDVLAEFHALRETMAPVCKQYGFAAMLSAELGNGAATQLAGLVATCEEAYKAVAQRVAGVRDLRRRLDAAAKAHQTAQSALNIANHTVSQKRTALHDSRLELAKASDATALFQTRMLEVEAELTPYLAAAQVPIESLRIDAGHALTRLRAIAIEVEALRGRSIDLLTEESRLNAAQAQKAALRQQAAVHRDELEDLFASRTATLQAVETNRGNLLGGEATSLHRTRFNNARIAAQNALDQAQTRHNQVSTGLATALEQERSAAAALANVYIERDQASSAYSEACSMGDFELGHVDELLNVTLSAVEALRSRIDVLDRAVRAAETTVEARRTDLNSLLALGAEPSSRAELVPAFEAIMSDVASLNQQLGAMKSSFDADETLRITAADLQRQSADKAAILAVWQQVDDAIGSPGGDRFRVFAQGLTLEQLLQLANDHLDSFSKRYHLARSPASDLSLHVIDNDMGDEERAIRTLSGGERFLVSLSLALALSSLEGRDFFVDTLFIDEGFGSLDAETLDVAITALETLHSRGRKVGVITHVAAMIENIPVQIKVDMLGGGSSVVRLAATPTYI